MAGHPLLPLVREETSRLSIGGRAFNINLSFHKSVGLNGSIVGLKFTDDKQSMDSSKKVNIHAAQLAVAIGKKVLQMLEPDIKNISILGFYLLTDDLSARSDRAVRLKKRVYGSTAVKIHSKIKHELPILQMLEVKGGIGWAMSRENFMVSNHFDVFVSELGKQLEVVDVNS